MALEILTPGLGKVKKSAKDLAISILLREHPLTLAKITNRIKKKFGANVTYQGVRKAVNHLVENKVVVQHEKEYSLNKEWILELRNFVEQLQEAYFSDNSTIKEVESLGEDIKVYTFDNLIDLDKFWNDVIEKWFDDDANNSDEKHYVQQVGHTWYVLGQLEEETSILEKMHKRGIKFYTFANGDTFLDEWCKKYYENQSFFYTTNKDKKKGTNARYFAIYNSFIIQSEYPEDLTNEIDEIYKKAKDFESFDATALIRLLRKKTDLKVTVMKNPVVAEQLRNFILSHFKP